MLSGILISKVTSDKNSTSEIIYKTEQITDTGNRLVDIKSKRGVCGG